MHIKVLKGSNSDLLECNDEIGTFYVVVPSGSTTNLRSASDWTKYFDSGVFSDKLPLTMRAAQQPQHGQPSPIPDGYATALSSRAASRRPTTRYATGHTAAPDGYAENLPVIAEGVDQHDGYAVALAARGAVIPFPAANTDGYVAALARRKES